MGIHGQEPRGTPASRPFRQIDEVIDPRVAEDGETLARLRLARAVGMLAREHELGYDPIGVRRRRFHRSGLFYYTRRAATWGRRLLDSATDTHYRPRQDFCHPELQARACNR